MAAILVYDLDFICINSSYEAISQQNKHDKLKLHMVFTYLCIFKKMLTFICYTMREIVFWDLNSSWSVQILRKYTHIQSFGPWAEKTLHPLLS